MERMDVYKKSLSLLDEFLAETSSADLSNLIDKYKKLDIQGPTFSEYLVDLQNSFESVDWYSEINKLTMVDLSDCHVYQLKDGDNYYVPPPPDDKKYTQNNKDSSIFEESFFLV
ncbi:MAG: hypothetical protein JWR54_1797 [Mucilaginibacter sp.]|nr:hypothetical protein [Mucilaginibacter sp.]